MFLKQPANDKFPSVKRLNTNVSCSFFWFEAFFKSDMSKNEFHAQKLRFIKLNTYSNIFLENYYIFEGYLIAQNQTLQAMDKNAPEMRSSQILKDAIIDSELLLSHASEQGLTINPDYIRSIVKAKKNEQNQNWTEKDEIEFWIAFQALSKEVQPVNIDSLRAAADPPEKPLTWWQKITFQKNKSLVSKSVNWYRGLALFSMIIMLALQIYGIIGAALMAKVSSGNLRIMEISKRTSELILITQMNMEDRSAAMEKTNLDAEQEELVKEVESSIQLLGDWLNFTVSLWSRETKEISKSVESTSQIPVTGDIPFGFSDSSHNIVIISQAKSLIIILNQYILPLLYGLLGGFAFVLRSLADETRRMVYTPSSDIKFGLRIHLGALAGLVIGFLWGDFQGKSFGLVESLSPLAVAFLAGYSVDFLFRLLDSIIGNITKKQGQQAEPVSKNNA
jgi:hypothetical protein